MFLFSLRPHDATSHASVTVYRQLLYRRSRSRARPSVAANCLAPALATVGLVTARPRRRAHLGPELSKNEFSRLFAPRAISSQPRSTFYTRFPQTSADAAVGATLHECRKRFIRLFVIRRDFSPIHTLSLVSYRTDTPYRYCVGTVLSRVEQTHSNVGPPVIRLYVFFFLFRFSFRSERSCLHDAFVVIHSLSRPCDRE